MTSPLTNIANTAAIKMNLGINGYGNIGGSFNTNNARKAREIQQTNAFNKMKRNANALMNKDPAAAKALLEKRKAMIPQLSANQNPQIVNKSATVKEMQNRLRGQLKSAQQIATSSEIAINSAIVANNGTTSPATAIKAAKLSNEAAMVANNGSKLNTAKGVLGSAVTKMASIATKAAKTANDGAKIKVNAAVKNMNSQINKAVTMSTKVNNFYKPKKAVKLVKSKNRIYRAEGKLNSIYNGNNKRRYVKMPGFNGTPNMARNIFTGRMVGTS